MHRYSIRFDKSRNAHVLGPEGWDDDLSEAVREALSDLSLSSEQGKYSLQLERFLCFSVEPAERCDAFLDEGFGEARNRCEKFLISLGCTVGPARGRSDKSRMVRRKKGNMGDIQVAIRVMRDFYDAIRSKGLFSPWNPMEIDGWEEGAARRIAGGGDGTNAHGHMGDASGNQFRIANREWYPPLPHDPADLARRVLSAVQADLQAGHRWPAGCVLLVRALIDGGARFEDTHVLNAADWAVGSRFGRGIIAPDKGSHGKRDKTITISEEHRQQLADSFDARHASDPDIPSMQQLRSLLKAGRLDELSGYELYTNAAGSRIKGSNFRNDWFRPCMVRHDVKVHSTAGSRRVTPHWLRHANVTARVAQAFQFAGSPEEIRIRLKELGEDFGWKTDMLERYAHNFFMTLRLEKRIATMDAINAQEDIRPRLSTMHKSQIGSTLLDPAIRDLHRGLPQ